MSAATPGAGGLRILASGLAAVVTCTLLAGAAAADTVEAPESGGASGGISYPVEDTTFIVEDLQFGTEELVFGSASQNGAVKEEGPKITLAGEVLFEPNMHTLSGSADAELERLVRDVQDKGARKITVVGHTDNVQGKAHNQKLSERRASTIGKALGKALGSDVEISTAGRGQDEPIADNKTEAGRKLNRRVEVTVVQ
ncbi:OmpA family protein [Arthrobacter sp. JSM 101049]|uniref:OmpA family protein n=1 Tax=Arthrobacter sp. JSM 101049 TaxID=929097 RepID=UPI0035643C66